MRTSRSFEAAPASVTQARRFVTGALAGVPRATRDAVEVMVSELATNAVRHARASFTVMLDHSPQSVRVDVTDRGPGDPHMRSPTASEPSGRGLRIVAAMADAWGIVRGGDGAKSVWFCVDVAVREPSGA